MSQFLAGAIIIVDKKNDEYDVIQVGEENTLPIPVRGRIESRKEIAWGLGPVQVIGYIDIDTFEIGLTISVVGISLGNFYGNLDEGVVVKIHLVAVKGSLRFHLKNGNEVWVNADLKVLFDGSFSGDHKIFHW